MDAKREERLELKVEDGTRVKMSDITTNGNPSENVGAEEIRQEEFLKPIEWEMVDDNSATSPNQTQLEKLVAQQSQQMKCKKTYADFLVDSCSDSQQENEGTNHMINCLRYRLSLAPKTNGQVDRANLKSFEIPEAFLLDSFETFSITKQDSSFCEDTSSSKSLYDVLLQLVGEFDAAGAAEIFRLLLERRSAIPLFVPDFKKHHLNLLRHLNLPGIGSIGEDITLMRFAVVSCRKRNESQTSEIMKNLFNIDSVHCYDFMKDCVTSVALTAEIGCGCLNIEEPGMRKIHNVLVVHVIGDFKKLWPFLSKFADHLLIEDAANEDDSFSFSFRKGENQQMSADIASADAKLGKIPYVFVWKPSVGATRWKMKKMDQLKFRHLQIEGQLGEKTIDALRSLVNFAITDERQKSQSTREKLSLYQIPILEEVGFSPLLPDVPDRNNIESILGNVKKSDFLLQKNYLEQAKHEEAKNENRLNEAKVLEEDAAIKICRDKRRADTRRVQNHPLLQLFLKLLMTEDSCTRVMSFLLLEKVLAERNERELHPKLQKIRSMHASYIKQSTEGRKGDPQLETLKETLNLAKIDSNETVINIEHLWRELSHLYTSTAPEDRSHLIWEIPRLAAQHLLDGFSVELLDGDSNMIHLEWMTEVFYALGSLIGKRNRERIFVLSVIGVQSSGKSTLLNTMFGVQLRTSVGQCTRGVNMQLLAVEGRPEYDFILLLDTEGTRSPEHHGLPGSEKRDNQMATLSILLADATIIVSPGENDAAIKEILPIVLMAYQGSQLAEFNGGRLSSKLFFVYNRIDTTQKNKLDSIIQTLSTSLNEAFDQVQSLNGNSTQFAAENPFGSFKLEISPGNDVFVLGNVKKEFEPPNDVPDAAYGEALSHLREHIHGTVVHSADGPTWKGRSIAEFSGYIEEVWKCICTADFSLNFASVVERMTFDKMDFEYKKIEAELAEAYRQSFEFLKKKMVEEKGKMINHSLSTEDISDENRLASFEMDLRDNVLLTESMLVNKVEEILKGKGREKWSLQYGELWKMCKQDQARNWERTLRTSFIALFKYEHHVENYKKKLRKEISNLYKSGTRQLDAAEMDKLFEEKFNKILAEAQNEFPPKDVTAAIVDVYRKSNVIKKRKIDINAHQGELKSMDIGEKQNYFQQEEDEGMEYRRKFFSFIKRSFLRIILKKPLKKTETWNRNMEICIGFVNNLIEKVISGKICYDDNIVSNFICETDAIIQRCNISANSEVEVVHLYGRTLITNRMNAVQKAWESENSVFAKLQQPANKEEMRSYFNMASEGTKKTQLFASSISGVLTNVITAAFQEEMVVRTSNAIRNERWLHDARFMHKHMDLFLADLLIEDKLSEVLSYISKPHLLYKEVLHRLIALKVPDVNQQWENFKKLLTTAVLGIVQWPTAADSGTGSAQQFVDDLRNEFLKDEDFHSELLAKAFLMDCRGEYDDCDFEDFQKICKNHLIKVINNQEVPKDQEKFAKELGPIVVNYMKTLNDPAALPRCESYCRMCRSLCIEAAGHDTNLRPHDAIHQPAGIAGVHNSKTQQLWSDTCSDSYIIDGSFYSNYEQTDLHKYRDYAKVFPGWKDPRINEELPLREFILAKYNKKIAKHFHLKACPNVPAKYFRDLSTIREMLVRETEG